MCNILSSQRGRAGLSSEGFLPKNGPNYAQHYQLYDINLGDKTRLVVPSTSLFLPKTEVKTRLIVTNINNINGDNTRLVVPLLLPISPKE